MHGLSRERERSKITLTSLGIPAYLPIFVLTQLAACAHRNSDQELTEIRRQLTELQQVVSLHTVQIESFHDKKAQEPLAKAKPPSTSTPSEKVTSTVLPTKPAIPTPESAESASAPTPGDQTQPLNVGVVQSKALPLPKDWETSPMKTWDEEKLFQTAYHLRTSNPREATLLFGQLIQRFPESPLADNALFWLGQLQLQQGQTHQAIIFWDKILRDYPHSNKVADALYEMSIGYEKLQQTEKALVARQRLLAEHPSSEAASKLGNAAP